MGTGELSANQNGQEPQNGDWFCPGCSDLQFRRNTQCRKCGTPNPGTGTISSGKSGGRAGGKASGGGDTLSLIGHGVGEAQAQTTNNSEQMAFMMQMMAQMMPQMMGGSQIMGGSGAGGQDSQMIPQMPQLM